MDAESRKATAEAAIVAAVNDDSRSNAILIVTSVFLAISLISVFLRIFVRTRVVRAFGWDDITMVLAMVGASCYRNCGISAVKSFAHTVYRPLIWPSQFAVSSDRRMEWAGSCYTSKSIPTNSVARCWYAPEPMRYSDIAEHSDSNVFQCWWLGQIFYVITCVVAKVSIIITLLRITVDRIHAWILYAAISLATAVGLIFLFFTIFQCNPVDHFWHQLSPTGSCVNKNVLIGIAYLYSVGAAVTDLTIGLLPVALIWDLRMNSRTKTAIVGILGIGCMFVINLPLCFDPR